MTYGIESRDRNGSGLAVLNYVIRYMMIALTKKQDNTKFSKPVSGFYYGTS